MKNTFGISVTVTLFGESHGAAIGAVIDGLAPGITVDTEFINRKLAFRRPSGAISTKRSEKDEYQIVSGVFNGKTTGTPIAVMIPNNDTKSKDYESTKSLARPGHADYTAYCKYNGFADYRGGGHFSGRITAALVAAGAIIEQALNNKNIYIGTHISKCAGVLDSEFSDTSKQVKELSSKQFAVLDETVEPKMKAAILEAASKTDSVGGILETAVIGLPAGVGEPWFDSLEGVLSHALFSVPGIKGVEFGKGFALCDMLGSEANDEFYEKDGEIFTYTNNNGGINGGITNGMPVIFRCAVKPTPSIAKLQKTVDFEAKENKAISIVGRHDPCIVHRARAVVDSITAIAICDMLCVKYGTDWLVK